ncbi:MAG TPA: branched-chain amino acid ABC transporter permease [Acidimicrobiales bacterium]|nr:branched-chain amino acid ABC transporter permease [Acidimicrobiales bacterium]
MNWGGIVENALRAAVGDFAAVFALAAIGLNVHFGYTGLLNFGQVGFMAVGAYGIAVSVTYLGLSLWVGVLAALGASVVLALLLGLPTLRLRADYLAIVTIAAAEIIRLTFRSVSLRKYTGGSSGLTRFADDFYAVNPLSPGQYGFGPFVFNHRYFWLLLVAWATVAVVTLMVFVLMRSPWGRVLKSIREDEEAARSLGKNVYGYKMQSLIFGGVIGSLAGCIQAISTQSVQPDTYSSAVTFFAYVVLILGGTARVLGPVVGSMLFWMLLSLTDNVLRAAVREGHIPASIMSGVQVGQVRFMLVGLGLMLLLIYRPQGIFGDRREIDLDVH